MTDIEFSTFESKYQVVLPESIRALYGAVDGMGDTMDNDLFRFWPLAEIKPVHEESPKHFDASDFPGCFIFADYCLWCWAYAFKLDKDPAQPSPVYQVTGGNPPGKQLTSSFDEFIERFADDPDGLL